MFLLYVHFMCFAWSVWTTRVESCTTGQLSGSLADRIAESDAVVWGVVVATEADPAASPGGLLHVYSAEIRVYCVLKGQVSSRIKVIKLGEASKRCVRVDLALSGQYLLMLNKVANSRTEYTADVKPDEYSKQRLNKITGYCGLNLSQPVNEAFLENGYIDCSSLQKHRTKPCTTLPALEVNKDRPKKESPTATERSAASSPGRRQKADRARSGEEDEDEEEIRSIRISHVMKPTRRTYIYRRRSCASRHVTSITAVTFVHLVVFCWIGSV